MLGLVFMAAIFGAMVAIALSYVSYFRRWSAIGSRDATWATISRSRVTASRQGALHTAWASGRLDARSNASSNPWYRLAFDEAALLVAGPAFWHSEYQSYLKSDDPCFRIAVSRLGRGIEEDSRGLTLYWKGRSSDRIVRQLRESGWRIIEQGETQ